VERRDDNNNPLRHTKGVETASIVVPTGGKGTYEIIDRIAAAVRRGCETSRIRLRC
jgi:hypothetical protein